MVGRRGDLIALRRHLEAASEGRGHCVLLAGEAGVGKSRLLSTFAQDASKRKVLVAAGSAFAMEAGVPYGAVADALAAPLRALDAGALTVLARGSEDELRAVVPGLAGGRDFRSTRASSDADGDAGSKSRLMWNVTQFLVRLSARQPLLLVLDNAHESDTSSLELLHFLVRQVAGARILVVLAYTDDGHDANPMLRGTVRSLLGTREATLQRVERLSERDLAELLQRSFAVSAADAGRHGAALWSHTRGNSFFVAESLKALGAAGRIRRSGTSWLVEDTGAGTLPVTVRDAVRARLEALDAGARRVAEIASVVEARASLALLERVSTLDEQGLADAIDTLCSRRILVEIRDGDSALYEFGHPIIQSVLRGELTAARERALHAAVANALEAIHGPQAMSHSIELARHLVRGQTAGSDERTLRYLAAAGRDALVRRADQEAARWLGEALVIAERIADADATAALLEDVSTARLRIGESQEAVLGWQRALSLAEGRDDQRAKARLLHHLAQEAARSGDAQRGLDLLQLAEDAAGTLTRPELVIRLRLARAKMQQALGRHADATRTVHATFPLAESLGNASLRARAHQVALQLYAWTGPAATAREHGATALLLAAQCGDREVAWASHWAMAMLEGFTGASAGVERHLREAALLADALASPVLQAMTAEITIEHASGVGQWETALALAERTIPLARAVMPQSLLPRVLVWTGLIVLARDDIERARALFEEAWTLTGADRASDVEADDDSSPPSMSNVHNVILAHTGLGTYHLFRGDWDQARAYGERGLALADRFGYVAWAIHRLIPLLIEVGLRRLDYDRVEQLTTRLRQQSLDLGHRLGMAWAAAAEALVARVKHHAPDAAARLLAAADELDAIPFVFHGAKIRRNAAQVLEADGDVGGAARELRKAHDVFVRLGAEFELRGVRNQLRALGMRLPPRTSLQGAGALTGRELEIARAVATRLSNKEIGAHLDISARTVSTHLSHIFEKLGVESRGELADFVRDSPLLGGAS